MGSYHVYRIHKLKYIFMKIFIQISTCCNNMIYINLMCHQLALIYGFIDSFLVEGHIKALCIVQVRRPQYIGRFHVDDVFVMMMHVSKPMIYHQLSTTWVPSTWVACYYVHCSRILIEPVVDCSCYHTYHNAYFFVGYNWYWYC